MVMVVSAEAEYRNAFEDFSDKARRVQLLAENPTVDRQAFESALLELEKAHLAYDEARDALIESLRPSLVQGRAAGHRNHRADVQAIAELLWQSAGRPTGTAEQDWLRAEKIVQTAVDASCS